MVRTNALVEEDSDSQQDDFIETIKRSCPTTLLELERKLDRDFHSARPISAELAKIFKMKGVPNILVLSCFTFDELSTLTEDIEEEEVRALLDIELSALWRDAVGITAVELSTIHKREPSSSSHKLEPVHELVAHDPKAMRLQRSLGKNPRVIEHRCAAHSAANPTIPLTLQPREVSQQALEAAAYIWDFLLSMGQNGGLWADSLEDPDFRNEVGAKYIAKWAKLSQIREVKNVAEAWIVFCNGKGLPIDRADPFVVESFCAERGKGGPTAPKHVFDVLRWLEINVGLPACTSLARVRRSVDPPEFHQPHREEPWEPAVWLLIEQGIQSQNEFVAAICLYGTMLFSSALRPCHLQRVTIRLRNDFAECHVDRGKRVVRGRQQPINIGVPFVGVTGISFKEKLATFLAISGAATSRRPFLLPDFDPPRSSFTNADGVFR